MSNMESYTGIAVLDMASSTWNKVLHMNLDLQNGFLNVE